MAFSKTFPRQTEKSMYPKWIEVSLTADEEREQEELCRMKNREVLKQCIDDARIIIEKEELKRFQNDLVHMAVALFEKRASHEIYFKEKKAKLKFDEMGKNNK